MIDWTIILHAGIASGTVLLFAALGGGLERLKVYVGDISFYELSARAALNTARAYLFAGYLRRIVCRLRCGGASGRAG